MTTSALTYEDLANYLRMETDDLTETEVASLDAFLTAAREYAANYTGLTAEQLDEHSDIAVAVLCVAGDLYTNRDMYMILKGTGNSYMNRTAETILNMYAVNLVPVEAEED